VPSIRHLFSSTSGNIAVSATTSNTNNNGTTGGMVTSMPGYLAIKIDPHANDMFNAASTTLNVVGASSALLSPNQLNLGWLLDHNLVRG